MKITIFEYLFNPNLLQIILKINIIVLLGEQTSETNYLHCNIKSLLRHTALLRS
jgi:hypothetical protein